jgi:hypothetical protein
VKRPNKAGRPNAAYPSPSSLPGQLPGAPQYHQVNNQAKKHGTVYSAANGGTQIINNSSSNITAPSWATRQKGMRRDTKVLLILLVLDVGMFFYGMLAYTGVRNDTGDLVRAVLALIMFGTTVRLIVTWIRRRI